MRNARILRSAIAAAAAITALAIAPAAAGAAPGGNGPASQAAPQATLVRTHVFLPGPPNAAHGNGGGRPQPATANCTPDDGRDHPSDTFTTTGFTTAGGTAHLNTSTVPKSVGVAAATAAVSNAFDAWHGADAQAPRFTVLAGASGITKQTANQETDVLWGKTPGNAIAVTYTWHWSTGEYESDTVFSNRLPWANVADIEPGGCNINAPEYDVQDIATHEFGHIYGLDHDPQRFATMYAYGYTGETLKRTLDNSDTAGINSIYQ